MGYEELDKYGGIGTELISLFIPHETNLTELIKDLINEVRESEKIKDKVISYKVTKALREIIYNLTEKKEIPENGLIIYSGIVLDYSGWVTYVIFPKNKLTLKLMRCDNKFYTDIIEKRKDGVYIKCDLNE